MAHNRPITPPPKAAIKNCSEKGNTPSGFVSVDKVRTRLFVPHGRLVAGRQKPTAKPSIFKLPYRWIDLLNGKIEVRSHGFDSIFVQFNPRQLEFGQNLSSFSVDITETLEPTVLGILPRIPEISFSRWSLMLLRAGCADLSEIHLAADFRFPSWQALMAAFRNLERSWNWRLNRKRKRRKSKIRSKNINYPTSTYWNQTDWTLTAYFKQDEIEAHHRDWPAWTRERSRNVLRFELRILRQDLRKLGERLHRWNPSVPLLDLSTLFHWEPWLYPVVFDFYAARLRSIQRKDEENVPGVIPLYDFLAKYGGHPVRPRPPEDCVVPSFYTTYYAKRLLGQTLTARADPHADDHLKL